MTPEGTSPVRGGRVRACVLTVSDRCSRGEAVDTSGPALAVMLREKLDAEIVEARCVPDERGAIAACILKWAAGEPDLIVTTGGTGLSARDVTPEAAMDVIERPHPGLMELARLRCFEKSPRAFLSRGVAGIVGRTLVMTLPGSERGATEALGALLDVLPHAIGTLRGEAHDDGRRP